MARWGLRSLGVGRRLVPGLTVEWYEHASWVVLPCGVHPASALLGRFVEGVGRPVELPCSLLPRIYVTSNGSRVLMGCNARPSNQLSQYLFLLYLFAQHFRLCFCVGELCEAIFLQIWAVITKVKSLITVSRSHLNSGKLFSVDFSSTHFPFLFSWTHMWTHQKQNEHRVSCVSSGFLVFLDNTLFPFVSRAFSKGISPKALIYLRLSV